MSDYTSTIITYRYKTKYEKHFFFLKMGTQDSLSCSVVQSLSCLTLCNPTEYSLLVVLRHHMELAQTNVHGVNDAIQPSHPLSWANYQSFSFSISSSNEYSWLISFRIDWFDFGLDWFAVQGTLKSLSSPTQQLKSINSSVFSLLYGPTLIFIHDYWKNDNFDYMDLCQQSDISAL